MGTVPAEYVSNEATTYTYDNDGRLVKEHIVTTYDDLSNEVHDIHYLYDDSGIIGMVKDSASYYFHRNIQGDVVGVYNSSGTKLVTFTYDAYGNCSVSGDASLASYCKIRYRGYYFDTETGLYWVQTRYYNPQWCRWISPDSLDYLDPESVHGLNLYAYCGNDPINYVDPSGHFALLLFLGTIFVSAVAGAIDGGISAKMCGQDFWKGFAAGAIGGALGGLVGFFLNGAGGVIGRAINSMTYNVLNELFQTGSVSTDNLGIYLADVMMDVALSMLYIDKVGDLTNKIIAASLTGIIDSIVDITQTAMFFTPAARQKIKSFGEQKTQTAQIIGELL